MENLDLNKPSKSSIVIMFVDDNPDIRTVFSLGLELNGHQVIPCSCGNEAIKAFVDCGPNSPDVLIVDYGLPGLNGIEVAKEIRKLANGANVVLALLTGTDGPEIRQAADTAGIEHFLNKPLGIKKLVEWIESLQLNPS